MIAGETQPADRAAAPGELALVQAFINTHYDLAGEHGAEVFASPAALRDWLAGRGLVVPAARLAAADVRRALGVREALRALAAGNGGLRLDPSTGVSLATRVELRVGTDGPRWLPVGEGAIEDATATLLAIVAREMLTGRWPRLKICPGEDCGWAFYDHSRNRSGRWCSMTICGGRAKARAHYRRRTAAL